jgi:organic radical activating enzyme
MYIRYKGIEHGIVTDAPFIGARICAIGCQKHCPGCFNQHLIDIPYAEAYPEDIIAEIKKKPLNRGIIFGGLEWTEQPDELCVLINLALRRELKVMIYTHKSITDFTRDFPELVGQPILVKCGEYVASLQGYYVSKYDVHLASGNQKIYNLKVYKAE